MRALPPFGERGAAMIAVSPICSKCKKLMRLVADMPAMEPGEQKRILFFCTQCETVNWVED
jgi:hypothetical protein